MRRAVLVCGALVASLSCRTAGSGFEPVVIDLSGKSSPPPAEKTATPTPGPAAPAPASARPEPPASDPERVVQTQLDAYNRHDLEALLATYANDAKLYDYPDKLRQEGLEQIRERYARRFTESPGVRATISRRINRANFVIDEEQLAGLGGGRSDSALVIYEVRDGKIARVWFLR